jgi:hypothetical protein
MSTTAEEIWELLGELIKAQKETDRLLREQSERADLRFQETERLIKEESIRLDKQLGQIGNSLGQFVEFQVRPAAVRLFQEMGIAVKEIATNVSVQGSEGTEIDILVVNSHEAIAIEVKSKLSDDDVKEHIARLSEFKKLLPRYENLNIMGAVAGMVVPENVARFAYRQGLFVIGQSGDNLVILNDDKFKPRCW